MDRRAGVAPPGGTVGYRFVDGFDGWNNYGKKDLNAPVYALTLRFGWFR